jgi:hypothetical protein
MRLQATAQLAVNKLRRQLSLSRCAAAEVLYNGMARGGG